MAENTTATAVDEHEVESHETVENDGVFGFVDAETREILSLLGDAEAGGGCCGSGGCCGG